MFGSVFNDALTNTLSVHNTRTVDFKSERGEYNVNISSYIVLFSILKLLIQLLPILFSIRPLKT